MSGADDQGLPPADPRRRRAELVRYLADIRRRLGDACTAAGREPSEVTLIAVTKTFPASDALALLELGVADLGENRDQEAKHKAAQVSAAQVSAAQVSAAQVSAGAAEGGQARWHFVGQLQTNKARSVASYAHAVHSLDRSALAQTLHEAVVRVGRAPLPVFIQVSLDGDTRRGGVAEAGVRELADHIAGLEGLRLAGVMAVAPMGADAGAAFEHLRAVSAGVQADHRAAVSISAGMSGDFETAIGAGSTHVRIGSALLGRRAGYVG